MHSLRKFAELGSACQIKRLAHREYVYGVLQIDEIDLVAQFPRRNRTHGNFILIERFRRAGVNTHRRTAVLHFRANCRHRDLRRFKAESQSRAFVGVVGKRNQVFRQIVEFSVDDDFRLFVRQIADVRKRDAQIIAGGADVPAVKIARVVKFPRVRIDKRIVVR